MTHFFAVDHKKTTTTWLTPLQIILYLGPFDTDPCVPPVMPWETARVMYTEQDNGLIQPWYGRVWLNPPYGPKQMPAFLEKMAKHNNGIALTFNRLETKQFHDWVFPYASALLFKLHKVHFLDENGRKAKNGPGAGSVFIAYGKENAEILKNKGPKGKFIYL